jgi:DNA-binding IclR family transcriptional regulator
MQRAEAVARTPRSAARIPRLLQLLADLPDGETLAYLSKASGTPKSSLLSLLRALTRSGFLQHGEGRYAIGPQALKLASAIVAKRRFPNIAAPIVDALANETGESAFLARVADDDAPEVVYVYRADSASALRFTVEVGSREPLYSTAAGRVLLAFQPAPWRERYIDRVKLAARTAKTIRSKRALRRLVAEARRRSCATSLSEEIEGVAGIAAPVLEKGGNLVAALVIGAPAIRAIPRIATLEEQVCAAAAELSSLMGYGER